MLSVGAHGGAVAMETGVAVPQKKKKVEIAERNAFNKRNITRCRAFISASDICGVKCEIVSEKKK